MEARATVRYVRITPRKANQILAMIRGTDVEEAPNLLHFMPKNGAKIAEKLLKSAVANAVNNGEATEKVRVDDLVVTRAIVGAGPTLKRFLPRHRKETARGDLFAVPRLLNNGLTWLLCCENQWLRWGGNFPFGVSVMAMGRRSEAHRTRKA